MLIIPTTVKLVYCWFGSGIALGAYGPRQDIDSTLNALYNFNGHKDEISYLSETFGYVLTDKASLKKGFRAAIVTHGLKSKIHEPRAARNGIWEKAGAQAEEIVESIEQENFLTESRPYAEYQYGNYFL